MSEYQTDAKQPVAVSFVSTPPEQHAIALDERAAALAAKKKRQRQKIADRIAAERLGMRVLRVKASTYALLRKQIDSIGSVKLIGHCKLMLATEKAESVMAELDAFGEQLVEKGESISPDLMLDLGRLKLDLIKVMVASGSEHLSAERQPAEQPSNGMLKLPFPAGTPIAVAIGNNQPQIEDASSKG